MSRKTRYAIILCGVILALVLVSVLVYKAPGYLAYREEPQKADCIIPLLGNEYIERKREAFQLISEGFSHVLLIPPRYRLERITVAEGKVPQQVKEELSELSIPGYKENPQYRWHENTHIELILAKEYMMAYGFTSAIIVSSPYHMRRVKILTRYVFPEPHYSITCVPDRFEPVKGAWWTDRKSIAWITKEYVKIGWFLIYHRFSEWITSFTDFISELFEK